MPSNILRRSNTNTTAREERRVNASATVFQIQRGESDTSRQIAYTDEFLSLATYAGATVVLPPPYNPGRLFQIIEQSNMVRQCVDAFVTNTVLAGWEIVEAQRGRKMDESESNELLSFIEQANSEEILQTVMEKVVRDRESIGYGFLEVIRDASTNVSMLRHCPALWTRLCVKDPKEVEISFTIQRGRRVSNVHEFRKFRRFVQIVNGQYVWFKEFMDPRRMDYSNGAFEDEAAFDPTRLATEIIQFRKPSNDSYGTPSWINQLPSILGSREAEEVNMRYFQDNTVPPLLLMVGNGRLTAQSYNSLTKALNQDEVGKARQNKIMLLEAVGEGDSLDGKNSPIELKVEKLTDARQSDGLFSAYDEANMAKVRSSFRLPPITVGMSQDVNFATASTSAFVAESQVFSPERDKIDSMLNMLLINGTQGMNLKTVKLASRTPSITSPDMVIKTLTALNVMGAVTPREAQRMANKLLQTELTPYPAKGSPDYEDWMDKPIIFVSKAPAPHDPNNPNPDSNPAPDHTQNEQAIKDPATKAIEATGNVTPLRPKNGQQ